jgi:hypothetical protein
VERTKDEDPKISKEEGARSPGAQKADLKSVSTSLNRKVQVA